MAHKSEFVATSNGYWVSKPDGSSRTQVITQDGEIKGNIKEALAQGSMYIGDASGVTSELSIKTDKGILIGNGTTATVKTVSGDATLSNAGVVAVTKINGATLGTVAATDKAIMVADGTKWDSVQVSGDASITNLGAVTVNKIKGVSVGTATATAGNLLVGDGTKWETVPVGGDATLAADGTLTVTSAFDSVVVELSKANILAMNATPIVVVPGVAGKTLEFLGATVVYDYDTATYGGGGDVTFVEETSVTVLSGVLTAAGSFGAAADALAEVKPVNVTVVPTAGKGICITNATGAFTDPGTAAGVGRLHIRYRTITTGL